MYNGHQIIPSRPGSSNVDLRGLARVAGHWRGLVVYPEHVRKLPESLSPMLGLELLRRMDTLIPEQYNHHQLTGLRNFGVCVHPYACTLRESRLVSSFR